MKKLLLLLYIPTAFMLAACEDFLDQQPLTDLSTDLFWVNERDAELGIAGMYDGLQKALAVNYIDWAEPRSDNFRAASNNEAQVLLTFNTLDGAQPASSWDGLYTTISRANFAIKYIPTITELDDLTRDHYLGQAYAMRAFCYFYAVRVWGGVPVWLEPYEDFQDNATLPRTPADDVVHDVILPDLEEARNLINPNVSSPVWEINIGSILAMLTEVYMWEKDYQNAIEASDELIALNRYDLVPADRWKDLFINPNNTEENIWSLDWDFTQDGANGMAHRYGSSNIQAFYFIDENALNLFESNKADIRRNFTYDTLSVDGYGGGVKKIGKFYPLGSDGKPIYPSTAQSESYLVLYRYADILLLRAEAFNKLGKKDEAVSLLNQVRTRAQLQPYSASDFNSLRELETAILEERQLELFGEGKRWFDLIRTDRVVEVMDPVIRRRQDRLGYTATGFGDPRRVLFPINQRTLNENPELVQNPPY